jgi:hypothetical protein
LLRVGFFDRDEREVMEHAEGRQVVIDGQA